MKIQCDCGNVMEDTGQKVAFQFGEEDQLFDLFACNSCGDQALFRKLEDDECYEI